VEKRREKGKEVKGRKTTERTFPEIISDCGLDRQTDRRTDRPTDRQTDRDETDRQTDRQTETRQSVN